MNIGGWSLQPDAVQEDKGRAERVEYAGAILFPVELGGSDV